MSDSSDKSNLSSRWFRAFPELAIFNDRAERRTALRRARNNVRYAVWLALISCAVCAAWGLLFPWLHLGRYLPFSRATITFFGSITLGTIIGLSGWRIFRRSIQRSLRHQLIELGRPVCLHCGYDLRGQTEPRCPECGKPFHPPQPPASDP
jgi:hypothetical protein